MFRCSFCGQFVSRREKPYLTFHVTNSKASFTDDLIGEVLRSGLERNDAIQARKYVASIVNAGEKRLNIEKPSRMVS